MEGRWMIRIPLFVFLATHVAAHVPPVSNITLHCQNFQNTLYWNYSQSSPLTRFRINIEATDNVYEPQWVDPPNFQTDISFLSNPFEEYYLTVTAVVGQNESVAAPANGTKFSYFKDSTQSDQLCYVDLPPVNVTILSGDTIEFRFLHPSLVYSHKLPGKQGNKPKKGPNTHIKKLPEFNYFVMNGQRTKHDCVSSVYESTEYTCDTHVCEEKLAVKDGQQNHCISIHGQWERVAVCSTHAYCASEQPEVPKTSWMNIPPVSNITLHCKNFQNTLYWNYSQSSPLTRFRINIGATDNVYEPQWVDPSNFQTDISFLRNPFEEYCLTVTAVVGQNESVAAPANGIKFSYFKDSTQSDQLCYVDLPPVNVTILSGDTIEFRFLHPSLVYSHKLPGKQGNKPKKRHNTHIKKLREFTYFVLNGQKTKHDCLSSVYESTEYTCDTHVCEEKLAVKDGQQNHCISIHGQWERVAVCSTHAYCAPEQPELPKTSWMNNYIYILFPLLACGAIVAILAMVYQKQTTASTSLPASMKFPGQLRQKIMGHTPLMPEQPDLSPLQASSPGVTSLLTTCEEINGNESIKDAEPDLRLTIGVSTQGGGVYGGLEETLGDEEGLDGDADEKENPSGGDQPFSGYEQRSKLVGVEMAPGDNVEGYRG
ncbi:growth/differentiation factor 10b [Polymixia lowei]